MECCSNKEKSYGYLRWLIQSRIIISLLVMNSLCEHNRKFGGFFPYFHKGHVQNWEWQPRLLCNCFFSKCKSYTERVCHAENTNVIIHTLGSSASGHKKRHYNLLKICTDIYIYILMAVKLPKKFPGMTCNSCLFWQWQWSVQHKLCFWKQTFTFYCKYGYCGSKKDIWNDPMDNFEVFNCAVEILPSLPLFIKFPRNV